MSDNAKPGTGNQRNRQVERVLIEDLSAHALHQELFDPPPDGEIEELASRMSKGRGTSVHVEIDPCGTVLFGAPYVEAARRAGWTDLEVTVRWDLEGVNEAVTRLELIDLHLQYGRLSKLAIARCLARAHGLGRGIPEERRRPYQAGKLEQVVADRLGVTVRNAARYLSVLALPRRIQKAFERHRIPLGLAERVKNLPYSTIQALAEAVEAGEDPRQAVKRHLPAAQPKTAPDDRQWDIYKKVNKVVTQMERAQAGLEEWVGEVPWVTLQQKEKLRQLQARISQLLAVPKAPDESRWIRNLLPKPQDLQVAQTVTPLTSPRGPGGEGDPVS